MALIKRDALGDRLDLGDTLLASAWAFGSFIALGLHVAVLALAVGGHGVTTVALAVGGMSLAIPAGVLFIPAPAGAGIRDVVLILVLRPVLDPGRRSWSWSRRGCCCCWPTSPWPLVVQALGRKHRPPDAQDT